MPILLINFQTYVFVLFVFLVFFPGFFFVKEKAYTFSDKFAIRMTAVVDMESLCGRWLGEVTPAYGNGISRGTVTCLWLKFSLQFPDLWRQVWSVPYICCGKCPQRHVWNGLPSLGLWCSLFVFLFFVDTLMHTGHRCLPGETMRLKHILICLFSVQTILRNQLQNEKKMTPFSFLPQNFFGPIRWRMAKSPKIIKTWTVPGPGNQNVGVVVAQSKNAWVWSPHLMMKWCLMSSDVGWHIKDKLRPMPKHGSINLYVHGSQKAR